jgi:hypothetical protein
MIDSGKELYFKDVLLPGYSDADKMGYTKLNGVLKTKVICGVILSKRNALQ